MNVSNRWAGLLASGLLALTAAPAGVVAAAEGEGGSDGVVEVEFWNYWDGTNGEAISALAEQFNDSHPGIQVKPVTFPWGDLLPKFQAAIAGGDLPAAGAGDIAWMSKLHASGALIDLMPAIESAGVAAEYPWHTQP